LAACPAWSSPRGYHLLALPSLGNRIRVSLDWLLDWAMAPQLARLGFLRKEQASMATAEQTGIYAHPPADEWEAAARDVPASQALVTDQALPRPGVRQPR
jgi:hypothetical protein